MVDFTFTLNNVDRKILFDKLKIVIINFIVEKSLENNWRRSQRLDNHFKTFKAWSNEASLDSLSINMIEILNLNAGDVVPNSIGYIFGKCFDIKNEVQVTDAYNETISWKVVHFYFKVKILIWIFKIYANVWL